MRVCSISSCNFYVMTFCIFAVICEYAPYFPIRKMSSLPTHICLMPWHEKNSAKVFATHCQLQDIKEIIYDFVTHFQCLFYREKGTDPQHQSLWTAAACCRLHWQCADVYHSQVSKISGPIMIFTII